MLDFCKPVLVFLRRRKSRAHKMVVSPPRSKGPPLNALRAFEAAARLGGFAAAGDELCVTPGAIAQHVKALEAWAGAQLFERRSQGVQLTPLGASVMNDFDTAFDLLGEAVQTLRSRAAPTDIRIAALPSVAQLWLSPRLPAIRSAAPEVTVSVTAMEWRPNLRREPFDLAVFFEDMPVSPGSIDLCQDVIFPVCAPTVAVRLRHPSNLANMTCLHDTNWSEDWDLWITSALQGQSFDTRGPVFSLYSLAVEEAQNGAGVLIGHEPLVRSHLECGALVAPFQTRVTLDRTLSIAVAKPAVANAVMDGIIEALKASELT